MSGYIYIITCENTSLIKIGFSASPECRIGDLQVGCPFPLTLHKLWAGRRSHEGAIHRKLKARNTAGEWFDISIAEAEALISDYFGLQPVDMHLNGIIDRTPRSSRGLDGAITRGEVQAEQSPYFMQMRAEDLDLSEYPLTPVTSVSQHN